jgi:membrane protein YqaA with SNARE-associated domain
VALLTSILLFGVIFLLNVIPAFAPPTWMVFSFIGFNFPQHDGVELAVVGALAATLGRLTLAKLSRIVIRQKFMSQEARENVDTIREKLQGRTITFGLFLLYAFSPLPSNYLFIAYGLTAMNLKLIAVPFFLGRSVSYSFWRVASSAVARKIAMESEDTLPYLSVYFVISQVTFLALIYVFARIDWKRLLTEHKFGWIQRDAKPLPDRSRHSKTRTALG